MRIPADWIPHRRADGELLGWMRPDGDRFVVVDLLGRDRTDPLDWLEAEETLDALGIGYLAGPYELDVETPAGVRPLRVRILEVSTERIRVKKDDFGAIDVPLVEFEVAFPMPPALRPLDPAAPADWPR